MKTHAPTTLPGLAAAHAVVTLSRAPGGYLDVLVWTGDDLRYVARAHAHEYEGLTASEAQDVLDASLAGWLSPEG